jgi:hypothetical protein
MSYIRTASGRKFDFVNIEANEILIDDIAHALSHVNRFTGHTRIAYSVAQHSVMVSRIVPVEHALAGLLHDATEAYLGDVSTPLKQLLPEYKALEARVEAHVLGTFGLPAILPKAVKHADLVMLATEKRDLMPRPIEGPETWRILEGIEPLPMHLAPLPAASARSLFLERFRELTRGQVLKDAGDVNGVTVVTLPGLRGTAKAFS